MADLVDIIVVELQAGGFVVAKASDIDICAREVEIPVPHSIGKYFDHSGKFSATDSEDARMFQNLHDVIVLFPIGSASKYIHWGILQQGAVFNPKGNPRRHLHDVTEIPD